MLQRAHIRQMADGLSPAGGLTVFEQPRIGFLVTATPLGIAVLHRLDEHQIERLHPFFQRSHGKVVLPIGFALPGAGVIGQDEIGIKTATVVADFGEIFHVVLGAVATPLHKKGIFHLGKPLLNEFR